MSLRKDLDNEEGERQEDVLELYRKLSELAVRVAEAIRLIHSYLGVKVVYVPSVTKLVKRLPKEEKEKK